MDYRFLFLFCTSFFSVPLVVHLSQHAQGLASSMPSDLEPKFKINGISSPPCNPCSRSSKHGGLGGKMENPKEQNNRLVLITSASDTLTWAGGGSVDADF